MKILFILQYIPFPLNSGGNQATFNMIDNIRKYYDTHVLLNITSKEENALKELKKRWKNVTFHIFKQQSNIDHVSLNFSYRFMDSLCRSMERKIHRKQKKLLNKKLKEQSHIIATQEDFIRENSCLFRPQHTFNDAFLSFVYKISRIGFDIIQTEFYEMITLSYIFPKDVYKIFVQHEIRFIRNQNELSLLNEKKASDIYQYNILKSQEISALSSYDQIIALTETDKELMLQEQPNLNIYVSPAMVVTQIDNKIAFCPGTELVFVGNGLHFPNADAILWFCKSIRPVLNKKGIMCKIYVVGAWGKEIQHIIQQIDPSICFTGFIDNLQEFLNGKISIIPIRIGSGMRMKILESVAALSPIITTSKGCEGLPFQHNENCLIGNTEEEFASAIEILIRNAENIQEKFAITAKSKMENEYNNNQLLNQRLNLYKSIAHRLGK